MSFNSSAALELVRRDVSPELYSEIRSLWKAHSLAEDRRDIPGLLATLTEDCVYELPQTGHRWEGHQGAEQFYLGLLGAFPDIDFQLHGIVIGPQGVYEEARAVGTNKSDWLGRPATGQPVEFQVTILFPWDPDRRRFKGERVLFYGTGTDRWLPSTA